MKLVFDFFILLLPFLASCFDKQVYIVYLTEHKGKNSLNDKEEMHLSYLLSVKDAEEAKDSLLYSYKHSINGFAALLTQEEAFKLSKLENVISVDESNPNQYSLDTTRSWDFLGLEAIKHGRTNMQKNQINTGEEILSKAQYGKNIIIGIVDTGIWPKSESFRDDGFDTISEDLWNGFCQVGDDFDYSYCNNIIEAYRERLTPKIKLIGATYYSKNFEARFGEIIRKVENSKSPLDIDGHGTHTASIATGQNIIGAEAFGGFAGGTASGGAPMAYLAMYKACWAEPKKPEASAAKCLPADILAAIDDAIKDGVHILSISIGSRKPISYDQDHLSIAALRAVKNNIVVVSSAGNNGPEKSTVKNVAPWIITVGASTIDRIFPAVLTLGNGKEIMGQTVTPDELVSMYPLVEAIDVEKNVTEDEEGQCLSGSLLPDYAKGKIILCNNGEARRTEKGAEVKDAGGIGLILVNSEDMGEKDFQVEAHLLPAITLSSSDGKTVLEYIDSTTDEPIVSIKKGITVIHNQSAPSVCSFSGRGPNIIDPYILKPDIIAPGLNILASWSEASSLTQEFNDHQKVKFNIRSGSSFAVPHVAAITTLLKAIHPTWSSAAIKSALITTASHKDNTGSLLTDYNGNLASPFACGSGQIRPNKTADPGLMYDISLTDYLIYLCSGGLKNVDEIRKFDENFECPEKPIPLYNLNYPLLALPNINGTITVERTITNVGNPNSIYTFEATGPFGFMVTASPKTLKFDGINQKQTFQIEVTPNGTNIGSLKGDYSYGYYTWIDSSHNYKVRSVVVASSA